MFTIYIYNFFSTTRVLLYTYIKFCTRLFSGLLSILLPQLLAMATRRGLDVTSHTSDTELKDESSNRIESEFRNKQLSPYVKYDHDLKEATCEKHLIHVRPVKLLFVRAPVVSLFFVPFWLYRLNRRCAAWPRTSGNRVQT